MTRDMTHETPAQPGTPSSTSPRYAELMVTSPFSFLRGASHADELVTTAKALGLSALAVTDHNSVAGVVRAHAAAKTQGLRFIPGCRLVLEDGVSLLCYPTDRDAWGRMTSLLTTGNRRAEKGQCRLFLSDIAAHARGQIFALLGTADMDAATLNQIREKLDAPLYLGLTASRLGQDRRMMAQLAAVGRAAEVPLLALGDVRYHIPDRRRLLDVMTAIRLGRPVAELGYDAPKNAEHFLKRPTEMARLFKGYEDALENTLAIQQACHFGLDELVYTYPSEPVPAGLTPQQHLQNLVRVHTPHRFEGPVPETVKQALQRELSLIEELGYAAYFLTVYDIVHYARSQGILCQGRGSAANSVVCYVLGITAVNPTEVDLLFDRFISTERGEPPDIDVDFEHSERERVIQYIYARYGRSRAGLAATVIRYRPRSAIREVGKALGLGEDVTAAIAGTVWGHYSNEATDEHLLQAGLDPTDARLAEAMRLTRQLIGFPRHLSQHVGGFVLTDPPLHEVVPIQNAAMADRTVVEWDKDDLDALGILKIDILALGMLSCLKGCFNLLAEHYGKRYSLASLPREDKPTYQMLSRADSIGVFQVESRAQMNMLPRLKPRTFYDLVIEVAIVRPGPIQGDMVHPYLKRRNGSEPVSFPSPHPDHGPADELEVVLGRTLGVPLFQEQAMKIAMVAAEFTGAEADGLRRAMASFRNLGDLADFRDKFIDGMTRRGYELDFAERCFSQIEGFGNYGFPESHAASFALLVYASSWLKCHYPAVFTCALLNAQPMGFYAPAQLIRDARDHGVVIRPVDINYSEVDNTLEPLPKNPHQVALRLGLRQVKGLKEEDAALLVATRDAGKPSETGKPSEAGKTREAGNGRGRYTCMEDVYRRCGFGAAILTTLAEADAFGSLRLSRRQALWEAAGVTSDRRRKAPALPLFEHASTADQGEEVAVALPEARESEQVVDDYQILRFSLRAHPLSFLRDKLTALGVTPNHDLLSRKDGDKVTVAGLVLVRQRPGSAKGVCFITLEDETGIANTVIWQNSFKKFRRQVMSSRLMMVRGTVQRSDAVTEGDIIHIVARDIEDISDLLLDLSRPDAEPEAKTGAHSPPHQRPKMKPNLPSRHPRNVRGLVPRAETPAIGTSRDFH